MHFLYILAIYLISLAAALPATGQLETLSNLTIPIKACPQNYDYGPQWPTLAEYFSAVNTACQLMVVTDDPNHPIKPPFTAKVQLRLTTDAATGKPFKKKLLLDTIFKVEGYGPLTQFSCKHGFGLGGNPSKPPWEEIMSGAFCARPFDGAVCVLGFGKMPVWWNTVEMWIDQPKFEHV